MRSSEPGVSTSGTVEVLNVSPHGIWILVGERELFMPASSFPWFQKATIAAIVNVELVHGSHLYWPDIDIDLDVDSIEHPESYPLVAR